MLKAALADLRDEAEIDEIIAHFGVGAFTNYFNHIAGTEIELPALRMADVSLVA